MAHRKAPRVRHDALDMNGERARTEHGTLRQKRGDTHAGTIEELYHVNLGVRSGKLLRNEGVESLRELLEKKRGG